VSHQESADTGRGAAGGASPVPELGCGVAHSIAGQGWCVTPGFLAPAEVEALAAEARVLDAEGGFRPAGVGRGQGLALRPEVRGDRIAWIDPNTTGPALRDYLARLEGLRESLNRDLYLGLFDFEGHLALYSPGGFYRRHLDQFRGAERRILSCILYLNVGWEPGDGGELRLYTDPAEPGRCEAIAPLGGTLVTFLSARFEHEVLSARRERLSLTGWFRRRA